MNKFMKFSLFILVIAVVLLALPGSAYAQSPTSDDSPVIFGSDYILSSGKVIKDLIVFGGNATIEQGSRATGDVVVFGGNLIVSGEVGGDVTAFGGNITVNESALVGGDLNTLGGTAQISPGATIRGKNLTGIGGFPLRVPTMIYTPSFWIDFGPGAGILSAVFGSLMIALMAVLVVLFLPVPTDRVALTIGTQPIISGALGLLTLIVSPALFLVLVITVILIPLGLVGLLVFAIAILFGWIAIGLELGKRMTGVLNTTWAIPVSAGVGTLVISLIASLTLVVTGEWFWALCCIGIPLVAVVMMVGLGGVVASKFGAQVYSPTQSRPIAPLPPAYGPGSGVPASSDWPTEPPAAVYPQQPVRQPAPVQPSVPPVPTEPSPAPGEQVPPRSSEPQVPPPSSPLPPPAEPSGPDL
jgi:hypothetical protein